MMGIPPSEVKAMTWWESQAIIWNWNDRHDPEGKDEPVEPPEADFVRRRQERLADMGFGKVLH